MTLGLWPVTACRDRLPVDAGDSISKKAHDDARSPAMKHVTRFAWDGQGSVEGVRQAGEDKHVVRLNDEARTLESTQTFRFGRLGLRVFPYGVSSRKQRA